MIRHFLINFFDTQHAKHANQTGIMPRIISKLDIDSTQYAERYQHHKKIEQDLIELHSKIIGGGDQKSKARHTSRGKWLVRERISQLLDPASPFLELSPLAGHELYEGIPLPAGGLIAGIGLVDDKPMMVIANDATVKGGTYFPITVKKHLRAQMIAWQNHLPCTYLVDSGGAFLPMQEGIFPDKEHFGRIFYQQAQMSAAGIPQIACVMGSCTAGGAYVPAMADQSIMVKDQATVFLGGPPLVKAATGEEVTAEELGGARVHCTRSGVADAMAENDEHAISILRDMLKTCSLPPLAEPSKKPEEPHYPAEELLGILPKDISQPLEAKEVIARLVDGSEFIEFKPEYGTSLTTGFAHIKGYPVGIIANNGILFSESSLKGTHFIQLCCQRKTPILFMQNIAGFMIGKAYEHGGITKDGAKLVNAVANADVPKLTLIIGGSFGAGNYGMCGRAFEPRFLWSWPHSQIAVMAGKTAADVLTQIKIHQLKKQGESVDEATLKTLEDEIKSLYQTQCHANYASARLWDDGVILPTETRDTLGLALAICHRKVQENRTSYGIFRM